MTADTEKNATSKVDVCEKHQMTLNVETNEIQSKVKYPTTYFETLTHFLRCTIGAGIFAMGDAFKNSGLLAGCVLTAIVGVINAHCQHILLRLSEEYMLESEDKTPPDYARTVELCFQRGPESLRPWATAAKKTINAFLCVMQLGFCAVYFVFVSSNLQKILSTFGYEVDIHIYMAVILVPIILECLIKNLKYIAPISMLANLLMFVGLAITFYYAAQDLPPISERRLVGDVQSLSLFFGTVIYAFVSIGLVIPLKNEMRNPSQFQSKLGVLNVGVCVVTFLLTLAGFLGYMKWGDDVKGSLTLNLPENSDVTLALQGILAITILLTLPIQFYVPVEILWSGLKDQPKRRWYNSELALRIGLVLITFTAAEAIPQLSIFISLVGATCSIAVALIIPAALDLLAPPTGPSSCRWMGIAKDALIILLGLFVSVTGTYEALKAVVDMFR